MAYFKTILFWNLTRCEKHLKRYNNTNNFICHYFLFFNFFNGYFLCDFEQKLVNQFLPASSVFSIEELPWVHGTNKVQKQKIEFALYWKHGSQVFNTSFVDVWSEMENERVCVYWYLSYTWFLTLLCVVSNLVFIFFFAKLS